MFVWVDIEYGEVKLVEGESPDESLDHLAYLGEAELIKYMDGGYWRWNGREWTRILDKT